MPPHSTPKRPRGYTLLEVLVSLTILLTGIVAIAAFFPTTVRQNRRAVDKSIAAYLAQLKAEEIRRDDSTGRLLIREIRFMTTPSTPVSFAADPRFAYSFCGVSLLDPVDDSDDFRDDVRVARIIVRYSRAFRPQQEILYELRFND
ncbi:prepilin-type N-terminal cleavage/methylation domain-containing protein [Candidatus Sumerlaeota bacterium]|nr:prepilin-type N-terminal cleavage/methylation domain-containing protein [Candidatus Sumerlaeota bacterium]